MLAGQAPATFGQVTLREFYIVIDAAALRDDRAAWDAAQYVACAFHSPDKMPDRPGPERSDLASTDPEIADEIRAIRRRVKVLHETKKVKGRNGR